MSGKILKQKEQGAADVLNRLKYMDKRQRHSVVATLEGRKPYTSLIAFALTPDARSIVFATPRKTRKYKNIVKNRNVSVLVNTTKNTAKDYGNAEAMTIQGKARILRSVEKRAAIAGILVKKHPAVHSFIKAASTALVQVEIEHCVHVNRFQ
jgi:nitroimidazol reductase NimA-like FMN-containing flavoprotein (pyridoxamine 5'-phosphate oxidase superfamily)